MTEQQPRKIYFGEDLLHKNLLSVKRIDTMEDLLWGALIKILSVHFKFSFSLWGKELLDSSHIYWICYASEVVAAE